MAENWDLVSAFGYATFHDAIGSAKLECVRENLTQVLQDAEAEHKAAAMAFDERPGFQWTYVFGSPKDGGRRQVCTVRCRRCRWTVSYDLKKQKLTADEARKIAAAAIYEHEQLEHADADARMRMRSWLGLDLEEFGRSKSDETKSVKQ